MAAQSRGPSALHCWGPLLASLLLVHPGSLARRLEKQAGASPTPGGKVPVFFDKWVVDTLTLNPDCQSDRPTAVVNGQLPGPDVVVTEGTQVVIQVTNKQKYPITLHWHGIHQNGSQWYDGVHGVTQCDILQGMTYTYNFSTWGHAGTLWWHTHAGFLRNSVFGGLYVEPANGSTSLYGRSPITVPIAGNASIHISDWYYDTPEGLASNAPGWVPPDAILINGASFFRGATCERKKVFELTVESGKWYRLRVVNAGLFAALNFAIQGHTLQMYESEGGYLKTDSFSSYTVLSGQSYQFLFHANKKPGNYWMRARPMWDSEGPAPGLGLLRYKGAPASPLPSLTAFVSGPFTDVVPDQLKRSVAATAPPEWIKKVDKLVVLELNTDQKTSHFSVNNVSLEFPKLPPLYLAYKQRAADLGEGLMPRLPPKGLYDYKGQSTKGFGTIDIPYGSVVQLVIQNGQNIPMNPHPFHLHGQNFYVVGWGTGQFDIKNWAKQSYNLKNPVFRNTAWVQEQGWTVVRFLADNPGVWLLHCHLEPHAATSMMAVFNVKKSGGIPAVPADYPTCNGTKLT